jgi:hypothetical protein
MQQLEAHVNKLKLLILLPHVEGLLLKLFALF